MEMRIKAEKKIKRRRDKENSLRAKDRKPVHQATAQLEEARSKVDQIQKRVGQSVLEPLGVVVVLAGTQTLMLLSYLLRSYTVSK